MLRLSRMFACARPAASRLPTLASAPAAHVSALSLRTISSLQRPLNLLVIDGYSKEGRADLEAGGASTAGAYLETRVVTQLFLVCLHTLRLLLYKVDRYM